MHLFSRFNTAEGKIKEITMRLHNLIKAVLFMIFLVNQMYGQGRLYEGPTDEAGDPGALRTGLMNGNRVSLRFSNKIALGGWPNPDVSLWPNDATGLNTLDALNLIIGNMVFIANDSIPVTDEGEIQTRTDLDTLWFAQSSALQTGHADRNPAGTIEWGFQPVARYSSPLSDYPAMSNREDSWPDGWPSRGLETKWPGEWNGRFGRGIKYATLESYYVANDAIDQENLQDISPVKYYPRPGVKIGDLHPEDITVQKGMPWGGLGIRAEVRVYQWNNLQSRDAVFFEYNITNISDYDLVRTVFGFYLDAANGNKAPTSGREDQNGFFDVLEDMSYTWSISGTGFGGGKPCVSGWAFLESPGIPNDGNDNDDDGLTDEKRDNIAAQKIGAYDGITDLQKFLTWYKLKEDQLAPHWDADEDQDWNDGDDADGSGFYEATEYAGDDLGTDGVGPADLNYTGPDENGTECNHRPDYIEGLGCEPDFGATDISESDMLGLTSFHMFPHPQTNSPQISYDKACYDTLASGTLAEFFGTPSNLYSAFGSGTVRFPKGRTERFSIAQINSYDALADLNSIGHRAPSLYSKKRIVQGIYESDYRFANAPLMPTLNAKAGDGVIYLSWDDKADKLTREPLLGGVNDFEGYKLYRASDKYFSDAEVLRDINGDAAGKKPIFQCDKIDSLERIPAYTYVNGLGYDLGEDTGIRHFYVDNEVQNGRTYYYGIVAYDYGIQGIGVNGVNIAPSENELNVDLDENENIRFIGRNVQVVTPHQIAAGYVQPEIAVNDPLNLLSSSEINLSIFNSDLVKANHVFKVKFETDTVAHSIDRDDRSIRDNFIATSAYSVYDATDNNALIYHEDFTDQVGSNWISGTVTPFSGSPKDYHYPNATGVASDVFEGLQLSFRSLNPSAPVNQINQPESGWVTGGGSPFDTLMDVTINSTISPFFAYDYDIVFSDSLYTTKTTNVRTIPVRDVVNNLALAPTRVLLNQSFPFYVINKSMPFDSTGNFEKLDLLVHDVNGNRAYDRDIDYVLVGYSDVTFKGAVFGIRFPADTIPSTGDVYRLEFTQPLKDSIMFTVNQEQLVDKSKITDEMNKIRVVPNPYIVTNTMESAINNPGLNQQRKLLFTHIPAQSKVKIFTSSGIFIRELDVENQSDNGTIHWDMLTKEGLEIAAGIYVYLVESKITSDKKIGKFAVIK